MFLLSIFTFGLILYSYIYNSYIFIYSIKKQSLCYLDEDWVYNVPPLENDDDDDANDIPPLEDIPSDDDNNIVPPLEDIPSDDVNDIPPSDNNDIPLLQDDTSKEIISSDDSHEEYILEEEEEDPSHDFLLYKRKREFKKIHKSKSF